MSLFEFDRIDLWGEQLTRALEGLLPEHVGPKLAALNPEYIEDAWDLLTRDLGVDRVTLVARVEAWISEQPIAGYHGSRLTPEELDRIRKEGLQPLEAARRERRLAQILAGHPSWAVKQEGLPASLADHGPGMRAGRREGQVHLTLSRAALLRSFPHYLTHGSEFDQRVAHHLLGPEGVRLLSAYGDSVLFTVGVPGSTAIAAANPYGLNNPPELIRQVIQIWSWWLANPSWPGDRYAPDCGMLFRTQVPADWIIESEIVAVSTEE